jgi:hypothetical protein
MQAYLLKFSRLQECVLTSCKKKRNQKSHKARGAPVCFRSCVLTDSTFFPIQGRYEYMKGKIYLLPRRLGAMSRSTSACRQSPSLLHMSCNRLHYADTLYVRILLHGMLATKYNTCRPAITNRRYCDANSQCIIYYSGLIQRSTACGCSTLAKQLQGDRVKPPQ